MTVIDEDDESQLPNQKALAHKDYIFFAIIGFVCFFFGWVADLITQIFFPIQVMSDVWYYVYDVLWEYRILGYPGFVFACLLGPFIAAGLAVITGKIIYKLARNKDVAYLSAILISVLYGFSPLSGPAYLPPA